MKRASWLMVIIVFLLGNLLFFPGSASNSPAETPPPKIYLPLIMRTTYTVAGTIVDDADNPISDVQVFDGSGNSALTDHNGEYALRVNAGSTTITALKAGFSFAPEELQMNVSQDVSGVDFAAAISCGDIMVNGSLNFDMGGWDFPEADAWGFSTGGTDATVFHTGPRSGRTGIPPAAVPPAGFDGSVSRAISQRFNLASDAESVVLGMWLYRTSTNLADNDRQFIQIRDADTNNLLKEIYSDQVNNAVWTYVEFSLAEFIGDSIKVVIGSLNDGVGGLTAMYFDDVTLVVCKSTPTPAVCLNKIVNSGFEDGTGWIIPPGQTTPPVMQGVIVSSGLQSMRTGIPLGGLNAISSSEFYQDVVVPSTVGSVKLSYYIYTTSNESPTLASEGPALNTVWQPLETEFDTQYGYVIDASNGYILQKLFWWTTNNEPVWRYQEFDLTAYKGKTLRIRFGTYNNGTGGQTATYLDDVRLTTCTGTSEAVGPGCYQAFNNRGFEYNSAWNIPVTEYPAAYTTIKEYEGSRSMRTGIYYAAHNRYSYSDIYQTVTIPGTADSATLKFWFWPKGDATLLNAQNGALQADLPVGLNVADMELSPDSYDLQYVLVTDKWGNILPSGWVWYDVRNDRAWKELTLNLNQFKGKTIRVWFGVYNNGWGDVTSMFLDKTSLVICDP